VWDSNQIRLKFFLIHSTQAIFEFIGLKLFFKIQVQWFILGMDMAKRFGIDIKYYASSLGIQMCNH